MADQIKEKIQALVDGCKDTVHIDINPQRLNHETAEEYLMAMHPDYEEHTHPEVWQKMIDSNHIAEVIFYPDTPVGSYLVLHHDLESALDIALEILKRHRG